MAKPRTSSTTGPDRWPQTVTTSLLAFLNVYLDDFHRDHKVGLQNAAKYLTTTFDRKYTAEQVKGKLHRLWGKYGKEDTKFEETLYEWGVSYRTLPYLDGLGLPFWEEFAAKVRSIRSVTINKYSDRILA